MIFLVFVSALSNFFLAASGIRAFPDQGPQGYENGINSAILRYVGTPDADPTSKEGSHDLVLVETNLHVSSVRRENHARTDTNQRALFLTILMPCQ